MLGATDEYGFYSINPQFTRLCEDKKTSLINALIKDVKKLHQTGYVHGDIKPENIACETDPAGNIKRLILIDLQDANKINTQASESTIATTSIFSITPDVVAKHIIDPRYDIISLAMLTRITVMPPVNQAVMRRYGVDIGQFGQGTLSATKDQRLQFIDALQFKEPAKATRNLLMY